MMVVRPAEEQDIDGLYHLAKQAGIGITTLPAEKNILQNKIHTSIQSFGIQEDNQIHRSYLFVLEDTQCKRIVATSAIDANAGADLPFYSYKIDTIEQASKDLELNITHRILRLTNDYQGKSELCTLFLTPEYRKHGNGVLISRARFLFMAQFPHLFAETVFAEMRGVSSHQGHSPFWQSLGSHFFQMDFAKADQLTSATDKKFITDLMPQFPIYVCLLSDAAQRVIGKPHPDTQIAVTLLTREGFQSTDYVDIFDGGPVIEAPLKQIRTVRDSQLFYVADIQEKINDNRRCFIANTSFDFRCVLGIADKKAKDELIITPMHANLLQVDVGDKVRIAEW